MWRTFFLASLMVWSCVEPGVAEEPAKDEGFSAVVDFVENHLIGRTLETRVTSKINAGQLETEFHRRTMYTHLVRTKDAATFDAIMLIRQQLWDLDANGRRVSETPGTKHRAILIRYGIQASQATGAAIGSSTVLSNSIAPTPGSSDGVRMKVTNGRLVVVQTTPVYFDGFAPGGAFTPTANTETTTFSVEDGKVRAETIEMGFDVDPETLARTPSGHQVRLDSVEIPALFP